MSMEHRARAFALAKASEIETESHRIGILRSLDATRAAEWLASIARAIREAAGPDEEEEGTDG